MMTARVKILLLCWFLVESPAVLTTAFSPVRNPGMPPTRSFQQGFHQHMPISKLSSFILYSHKLQISPSNGTAAWILYDMESTGPSSLASSNVNQGYKIYCDMDGVLVDFEGGVRKLVNIPTSRLLKRTMWKHVSRANAFFENLSWTWDGKELWEGIRHLKPDILTGVPDFVSSRTEKYNWCKRELGIDRLHHVDMAAGCGDHESVNGQRPRKDVTNIITCWSNNKHRECDHRSVLIDDRECLRESWERAGGVFIHHVSTQSTLQQLRDRGIL